MLTSIENFSRRGSSCVFVSKGTDVTMVLALAERLYNRGFIHVMGENIIDIDPLLESVRQGQVQICSIACAYVLAGCDFTPGTCSISQERYLRALLHYRDLIRDINLLSSGDVFELLTLLAYLEKYGKFRVTNAEQIEKLETE